MSKFPTLAFLVLLPLSAVAETVLWKGSGTVTNGTGVFSREDLPPEAPVSIRVTYDDKATPVITTQTLGRLESDYRENLDLDITVSVGSYTWRGEITTASPALPNTFFTKATNPFPTAEFIKINLASGDGASFSNFPFRLDDTSANLLLDVVGKNSGFLGSGITSTDIDLEQLSSVSGKVTTGVGNELTFSIDPASFEVLLEKDEIIPPTAPIPTLAVTPEIVSLSWQSDFRFRYRVETTDDLAAENWTVLETRNGTDTIITRDYQRAEADNYFRVVAIERPSQ